MKKCTKCGAVRANWALTCRHPHYDNGEFIPNQEEKSTQEKPVYQQIIDTVGGEEEFCKLIGIIKEPRVDFEMLNQMINWVCNNKILHQDRFNLNELENLELFFKLLSTKPTFANVAHKELSKLNK